MVIRKNLQWTDAKGKKLSVDSITFLIRRAISRHGTIKRFNYGGAQMALNAVTKGASVVEQIIDKHVAAFIDKHLGMKP
jgi:hypothetical protein